MATTRSLLRLIFNKETDCRKMLLGGGGGGGKLELVKQALKKSILEGYIYSMYVCMYVCMYASNYTIRNCIGHYM